MAESRTNWLGMRNWRKVYLKKQTFFRGEVIDNFHLFFLRRTSSHYVAQVVLKLLVSSNLPAFAS
jgi:hypothetical protein